MVFSKQEAAGFLRISPITIDRYRRAGRIPCRKIGDRVVFTLDDLQEFLNACAVPATAAPSIREQQAMATASRKRLQEEEKQGLS